MIPKNDMRQRVEGRSITKLSEYIEQKLAPPKHTTFESWWEDIGKHTHVADHNSRAFAERIWNAAQAAK